MQPKFQIGEKVWTTKHKLPFRVEVVGVSIPPESDIPIYKVEPTHRKVIASCDKRYAYCKEQDLFREVGELLHNQE